MDNLSNIDEEEIYDPKTSKGNLKKDCWSKNNGDIRPRDVLKKTRKGYLFICDVCNHEFTETIYNIVKKNKWCGYCMNDKLCDDVKCKYCYENSFDSYI
tara:strand:- start:1079 stop:1375 length:297 start_codon:yes stop_codon:yes gene_type:complete